MEHFGPETYGERVADVYDEWYKPVDTVGEVALLTELSAGGPARWSSASGPDGSRSPSRFAWPPELDLMVRLAGLSLEHRGATFDKQPFSAASPFHVSVYRA